MSLPIGITDPRVVKAYAHPLRIRIHALLGDRVASPSEIASELDVPLSNASYHVRRLLALGLIELVERVSRRGAIEHRYTARYHVVVSDEEWGALPALVKHEYIRSGLEFGWAHVAAAAAEGGFDRSNIHYSRTHGIVDDAAWNELAEVLKETLDRIEDIMARSERRADAKDHADAQKSTIIMMHFAGPAEDLATRESSLDQLRLTSSAAIRAARDGIPDG